MKIILRQRFHTFKNIKTSKTNKFNIEKQKMFVSNFYLRGWPMLMINKQKLFRVNFLIKTRVWVLQTENPPLQRWSNIHKRQSILILKHLNKVNWENIWLINIRRWDLSSFPPFFLLLYCFTLQYLQCISTFVIFILQRQWMLITF